MTIYSLNWESTQRIEHRLTWLCLNGPYRWLRPALTKKPPQWGGQLYFAFPLVSVPYSSSLVTSALGPKASSKVALGMIQIKLIKLLVTNLNKPYLTKRYKYLRWQKQKLTRQKKERCSNLDWWKAGRRIFILNSSLEGNSGLLDFGIFVNDEILKIEHHI